MEKRLEYSNYRVEVEVEDPWFMDNRSPEERHQMRVEGLNAVVSAIKRHVDNVKSAVPMWDTEEVVVLVEIRGER